MSFIEVKGLVKKYKTGDVEVSALDDVSFEIEKGEIVVIVGASGAGKTTLLNLIGGMDNLTYGKIIVDGRDISNYNEKQLTEYRRNDIGFVFQFYNLVQNLTVEENIMLPVMMDGKKEKDYKMRLEELLDIVGLKDKRNNLPKELSGGQQQRVSIARAMILSPNIILADEPIGNLDSKSGEEVMKLFKKINKEEGITILQVTHSLESAQYGNRIINLKDGKII